jgi:hypothetical protein
VECECLKFLVTTIWDDSHWQEYFGYEVTGPLSVNIVNEDVRNAYKTITVGEDDNKAKLRFYETSGQY